MNILDTKAFQYPCFEYLQDNELFSSFLKEDSPRLEKQEAPLFTSLGHDQLLCMPYERFDMISAGSLDNSGDLFEEDKSSLSGNKLFSIETFFNGPHAERHDESSHENISSTHSCSNLGLNIQQFSAATAKTDDSTYWPTSPNLMLPSGTSNSDGFDQNVNGFNCAESQIKTSNRKFLKIK